MLRGPAARVVTNMEASLEVPTATSVRGVPAKLLIDNRTVINNHLRRSRGGKISFTHVIAWAVVQTLRGMPEMNASFAEIDGKPSVVHPEHINLGIAIDLQRPDGTRQLMVPCIKGVESMDFTQFWSAYEDLVRQGQRQCLDRRRLHRDDDQPDQPRNDWNGSLGSSADEGAGRHRRRRCSGVPGRVPGGLRRNRSPGLP